MKQTTETTTPDVFAEDPFAQVDWHDVRRESRDEDEIERDGRGAPRIHLVDPLGDLIYVGKRNPEPKYGSYTRVTTWAKTLEETSNLSRWAQRMAVLGVAERRDLQLGVMAAKDDKQKLDKIVNTAKEYAKANVKRDIGTALHSLTQRHDEGKPLGYIPEEFVGDVDAYISATRFFEPVLIEKFVVNDELRTGGTPDRVWRWKPCCTCGADLYIGDLKSGSIVYGQDTIGMQLGIYANSKAYNVHTGERTPLPEPLCRCKGIVIWLPPEQGLCELEWFDIAKGWERAKGLAREVRRHRNDRAWKQPFKPSPTAGQLHEMIQRSRSREEALALHAQWKGESWAQEHTDAAALLWSKQ